MCGGNFINQQPDGALEFLASVAENSRSWDVPAPQLHSASTQEGPTSSGGILKLSPKNNLQAKIRIEEMESNKGKKIRMVKRSQLLLTILQDPKVWKRNLNKRRL